jgi:hypothetical protein
MFEHQKLLNDWNYFTPGKNGYTVFAVDKKGKGTHWSLQAPVRVKAMAVGNDRLVIAGPPDVLDHRDPLAAFRGAKGGVLAVLSTGNGKKLTELQLDCPPVFNGLAAAHNSLFVSLRDGSLVAIGED